ncbi:conjugative transposon protein TraK [Chitinophaga sp. YIM B06452]|uniref:conjugative transposon protein TraK n=1 Tax=Chitinophaga sp. YIM B06452 TaxID=3082158 RepID=UPI0031FF0E27
MFKQLKNIDTAFKHIQLFCLVLVIATTVICCYTIYRSQLYVDNVSKRIYVMINGQIVQAQAGSREENLAVEARKHVDEFHRLFFTLTPDQKAIDANISRALYLADKTAKQQYDNLRESGYYAQIISANISQEVMQDSIVVQLNRNPYQFRFYGKQRIVRPTAIVIRSLVTEGNLRELKLRTDQNSHALLIERWTIVTNEDIEVIKR